MKLSIWALSFRLLLYFNKWYFYCKMKALVYASTLTLFPSIHLTLSQSYVFCPTQHRACIQPKVTSSTLNSEIFLHV